MTILLGREGFLGKNESKWRHSPIVYPYLLSCRTLQGFAGGSATLMKEENI